MCIRIIIATSQNFCHLIHELFVRTVNGMELRSLERVLHIMRNYDVLSTCVTPHTEATIIVL